VPNQNAIAVAWANTKVRPLADLMYSVYLSAKKFKQMADGQAIYGAGKPIPNDATLIDDGSLPAAQGGTIGRRPGDGRTTMTNAQATNLYNRAVDLINWFEGGAAIAAGDGSQGVGNTILGVEVNGKAAF
jgi:hypothetical protein